MGVNGVMLLEEKNPADIPTRMCKWHEFDVWLTGFFNQKEDGL